MELAATFSMDNAQVSICPNCEQGFDKRDINAMDGFCSGTCRTAYLCTLALHHPQTLKVSNGKRVT